jgi:hypothetical protein
MASLLVGPLLRYVSETEATVWVETDAACEVDVLGRTARTFHVEGHHYAIVALRGLTPGRRYEYTVRLDGELRWPEIDSALPPSVIRTVDPAQTQRIVFGSCRVSAPHTVPYSLDRLVDRHGRGLDALVAFTHRLMASPRETWPQALLLLGDQVYADDVPGGTRAFIESRRDVSQPPGAGVADFEEFTFLYRESWTEPIIRWLLSTVSTSMIFDDHDVHDDWNTSESWVADMRRKPWWSERIVGAFMSYWIYQHLGNLSPHELDADPLLAEVLAADDAGPLLRRFSEHADRESAGSRWAYRRDLGPTRVVVLDSRAARVLRDGRREMIDEEEWRWVEENATGDVDHLVIASSLPFLLAPGMHDLQAWNAAVAGGAWGPAMARFGEWLRRAIDLEHWAAFGTSFDRLAALVAAVGSGRRGRAPASIVIVSGDVHHGYLARVVFRRATAVSSAVYQAVCSPFRNSLGPAERRAQQMGASRVGALIGRALAAAAHVPRPRIRWRRLEGLAFENQIATLEARGREMTLIVERAVPSRRDRREAELEVLWRRRLAPAPSAARMPSDVPPTPRR